MYQKNHLEFSKYEVNVLAIFTKNLQKTFVL